MRKTVSASPHITNPKNSTRRIMIDVLIALLPCVIAATVFYGYHVIINIVTCLIFCFGTELLYGLIINKAFSREGVKKSSVFDFSFAVTAVILALNVPATMTVWGLNVYNSSGTIAFGFDTVVLCALGSIFAIALVKMLFGGIGKNFANPACTGRIFLFIAFGGAGAFNFCASLFDSGVFGSGATWLGTRNTVTGAMLLDMFFGNTATAAVGETCAIAILVGYIYLSVRRVIDARIPLIAVASTALFVFLFDVIPSNVSGGTVSGAAMFYETSAHVLSGGLLFGSVFMLTDYSTSPNTFVGNVIFAVGVGLITALIRSFGNFPEGFSFALLIMNLTVPLLDKYIVPKPFGYVKPVKEKKRKKAAGEKGGERE